MRQDEGSGQIQVLLADDHPVVREGLRGMLAAEPDISVVAEAGSGSEAVAMTLLHHPDVVLMDLRMPSGDGVDAITRIQAARSSARIIVLTTYDTDADILRAVEAGAAGYLLKDTPRAALVSAIRAAARGETVLAAAVAGRLMTAVRGPQPDALSARETEVLGLVSRGLTNAQIGRVLFVSEATVKTHLMRACAKLGVTGRTAAVTKAMETGALPPPAEPSRRCARRPTESSRAPRRGRTDQATARQPGNPGSPIMPSAATVTDEQVGWHPDAGPLLGRGPCSGARLWVEARVRECSEPDIAAERPEPMRLAHHLNGAVRCAQHELVLGLDPVVGRIRIPDPFAEAALAAIRVAAAATTAARAERLGGVVGNEHRDAARPAVRERRPDHLPQVVLARDVVDRIVDQDRVERPAQPDRPHVALNVLTLGVDPARDCQHLRGAVDQGQGQPLLEMQSGMAAAAAQIQHLAHVDHGRVEHQRQSRGVCRILRRR